MRLTSEMREGQAEWAGTLLVVLGSPLLPSRCRRMMRTTESSTCLWSGPADGTHRLAYRLLDMGAKTGATAAPW